MYEENAYHTTPWYTYCMMFETDAGLSQQVTPSVASLQPRHTISAASMHPMIWHTRGTLQATKIT